MSEVDNFVSAIKEKRNEAVDYFMSEDFHQAMANGVESPEDVVKKGVDQLVGAVLDVVEERYTDLVTGSATDSEGEEVSVELSISTGLSTLYFEEVAS
jgi:hypothetical protein